MKNANTGEVRNAGGLSAPPSCSDIAKLKRILRRAHGRIAEDACTLLPPHLRKYAEKEASDRVAESRVLNTNSAPSSAKVEAERLRKRRMKWNRSHSESSRDLAYLDELYGLTELKKRFLSEPYGSHADLP